MQRVRLQQGSTHHAAIKRKTHPTARAQSLRAARPPPASGCPGSCRSAPAAGMRQSRGGAPPVCVCVCVCVCRVGHEAGAGLRHCGKAHISACRRSVPGPIWAGSGRRVERACVQDAHLNLSKLAHHAQPWRRRKFWLSAPLAG